MRLHGGVQAAEIEAVVDPAKGLRREPQREAARHHSRPWQQWHAAEARPSSEQPHQPLRRSHERDDARYGGRTRGPERCSLAEAAHGASGAFQRAIWPRIVEADIDGRHGPDPQRYLNLKQASLTGKPPAAPPLSSSELEFINKLEKPPGPKKMVSDFENLNHGLAWINYFFHSFF